MTNIRWTDRTNMTLLTDFYELTMSKGYLDNDMADTVAYFAARFPRKAVLPSWPA